MSCFHNDDAEKPNESCEREEKYPRNSFRIVEVGAISIVGSQLLLP